MAIDIATVNRLQRLLQGLEVCEGIDAGVNVGNEVVKASDAVNEELELERDGEA